MVLDESQIIKLIKQPYSKEVIEKSIELTKVLERNVNGKGSSEYLSVIEEYENDKQLDLRRKTHISQKHILYSIIRIINKIFSAKGGSNYYDIAESKQKPLQEKLKDIRGVPLRKWIQNKGLNKYLVDPNGVFLVEVSKKDDSPICYPTYKSINVIHDYKHVGRELEYLIIRMDMPKDNESEAKEMPGVDVKEQFQYFRVYDDVKDILVKYDSTKERIEVVDRYKNIWGKVPGIIIGDLFHSEYEMYDSRFSVGMELSDKRLRTESVKNVYEFKHGFPLTWQLLTRKCTKCDGTGYVEGHLCTDCNGTGYDLKKDVSKVLGIFPPRNSDEPTIDTVGGYVQPDLETWQEYRLELDWLEKLLQYTLLGSYTREKQDRETATSRFIDVQPVNDTLNDYADWVETTEQFITNLMGMFYFPVEYKGSSINLGRRYMIESPDEVWAKYEQARKIGAPTEKLDDDMIEYYETKYVNDLKTLEIQKKLFWTNDYRHVSIQEAREVLPESEYIRRVYYDKWVSTLDDEYLSKEETTVKVLKDTFDKYVQPFINKYEQQQRQTETASRPTV